MHFGASGQVRDFEAGQDFFNARYFTGALGRFNSPDPANIGADMMNPQSWNGYAYVLGNPLASVDPSGMFSQAGGGGSGPGPTGPTFGSSQNWCLMTAGNNARGPGYPEYWWPSSSLVCGSSNASGPGSQGRALFRTTGFGAQDISNVSTPLAQQAPNSFQVASVLTPRFPKANPQECASLAQKISNLRQELRNKAYQLETNPSSLPDEAPGQPLSASRMGHVGLYIQLQASLTFRLAQYNATCGGDGPPPPVAPTAPIEAPANFKIPAWLLLLGGASVLTTGASMAVAF